MSLDSCSSPRNSPLRLQEDPLIEQPFIPQSPSPVKPLPKYKNNQKLIGCVALGALALLTVIEGGLTAKAMWLSPSTNSSIGNKQPTSENLNNMCPINDICTNTFSFKGNMTCDFFNYKVPTLKKTTEERLQQYQEEEMIQRELRESLLTSFQKDNIEKLQRYLQDDVLQTRKRINEELANKQTLEANIYRRKLEITEKENEIKKLSQGVTRTRLLSYIPGLEDVIDIVTNKERKKIVAKNFQGEGTLVYKKMVDKNDYSQYELVRGAKLIDDERGEYPGQISAHLKGWKMEIEPGEKEDLLFFTTPWKSSEPLPSIDIVQFISNLVINEASIMILEADIANLNRKINEEEVNINRYEGYIKRSEEALESFINKNNNTINRLIETYNKCNKGRNRYSF